jgi:ABC-type sugar transport system permease subunit
MPMVWQYVVKNTAKIALLGTLCAVAVYVFVFLGAKGMWIPGAMAPIGAAIISYVFLSQRRYPLRWLIPGLLFLAVMVVYPIGYTFVSSFTDVGTGHMLSKDQAVAQLLARSYAPPDAVSYSYVAFADPSGNLALLLQGGGQTLIYVDGVASDVRPDDPRLVDENGDGQPDRFDSYVRLSTPQLVQRLSFLETLRIEYRGTVIGLTSLTEFKTRTPQYAYDPSAETMTDLQTGAVYTARDGVFTSPDGKEIYPGYRVTVGLRNYINLVTNPQIAGPFAGVFLWTFIFATLTVALNFILGLFSAILLNDPFLRFRTLYRVLAVIPYALPAFVTILVWQGMLNPNFGVINQLLVSLFGSGARVAWLSNGTIAKASVLLVNLWLGYPYMMLISLGALQSIPSELYEAARVDGAGWWARFRKITLPLLLMPLAPLLIGSFAFNFNNFTLIWLLTQGRPAIAGAQTPAGATDILISYTYRLAFEGGRGNQFGLAAAVSVMIFVIIATISAINFRMTGALEELSRNV